MNYTPTTEALQEVNSEQAYFYRIIPISNKNNGLTVITDASNTENLEQELTLILGRDIIIESAKKEAVDELLYKNYRKRTAQKKNTSLTYSEDFLTNIIQEAKEIGSSDLHFEPFEKQNRVRFRIDGKLLERYIITNHEYPKIVNRLKIMAGLDISEKRLPQDGRINVSTANGDFDIRVSSLPILHGEKLVLRILSKNNLSLELDTLGFSKTDLEIYKKAVAKPNGIVLISGPTGSGKTTTLYATLKFLNTVNTNILTIEDPIEYTLDDVNQVQLRESIGLDFASTLRTFLRQDPDVIMVGEIRDPATANMAIRASLTEHLVLSTIHANSAWGTISRLIDMDIPPFLIASTLNVSVAQRLIRKLCDFCKQKTENTLSEFPLLEKQLEHNKIHQAIGCPECYQTGYKGRKAIYEIIPINQELVNAITEKKQDIYTYLKDNKIATLQDNAIELVKEGVTSIQEIYPLLI